MTLYRHVAKVSLGGYAFPIDMLRYDDCWPFTADDAREIESSLEGGKPTDQHVVFVETRTLSKLEPWTVSRWISFGADIEHTLTEKT